MKAVSSMTGFATACGEGFRMTIKSVNHRFLDLQVRVPAGCEEMEAMLRSLVREAVRRGHVEVSVQVEEAEGAAGAVRRNDVLLGALVEAYRKAAEIHGLSGEPDLNVLLRSPGVLSAETSGAGVALKDAEAEAAVLLERFLAARALEGAVLAAEMRGAMDRLVELAGEVAGIREGVRTAHMARLRWRLEELVVGMNVPEDRLVMEAALLADRSDVEEEIVRLRTHARQFQAMLDAGGEVGKRLDFLLQEMNREANTMLAKVNGGMGEMGLRLTEIGLGMKAEIERVKEQVQNVE